MNTPQILKGFPSLQNWEFCEEVGHGSFGTVYRVRHLDSKVYAALKWIRITRANGANDKYGFLEMQRQILGEISAMRKLSDIPQVVDVQDYAIHESEDGSEWNVFIWMEYLTPLMTRLRIGSFSLNDAMQLLQDVGMALEACHALGVVHGDIKPENILCGKDHFKLTDFGIVTVLSDISGPSVRSGTRAFTPPEYVHTRTATQRGDLYSLGLTAYLLFNGGMLPCCKGFTDQEERMAALEREHLISDNRSFNPPAYAPEPIADVILRACSPRPEDRFTSATEWLHALEQTGKALEAGNAGLQLPFLFRECGQDMRLFQSTGHKTEDFFNTEASAPLLGGVMNQPLENETQLGVADSFVKPGQETVVVEEKPLSPQTPVASVTEKISRKQRRIIVVAVIICAITLTSFGVVRLVRALNEDSRSLTADITPAVFSAQVDIKGHYQSVSVSPSESKGEILVFEGTSPFEITGLAPNTKYVLMAGNRQTTFTTFAADAALWTPMDARIYAAPAATLEEIARYVDDLHDYLARTNTGNGKEILLSDQLRQPNRYYMYCSARREADLTSEAQLALVLRMPNGEVYETETPCVLSEGDSLYFMVDIGPLFTLRFETMGSQYYGSAQLEMYVSGGLTGMLPVTIKNAMEEGNLT